MHKVQLLSTVACAAAIVSLSAAAADQPSSTSQTSPSSSTGAKEHGNHMADEKSVMDKVKSSESFAKAAALGGMTEVEASKLALSKSTNADIKSFAQRMVTDHSKTNDELKSLAKTKNIMLPTSLDAEHRAKVDKLNSKSAAEFDAAYSKAMDMDHAKTVALFRAASTAGGVDKDLQAFAKKTLPTLEDHSQQATRLTGMHTEGSRNASANVGSSGTQQ